MAFNLYFINLSRLPFKDSRFLGDFQNTSKDPEYAEALRDHSQHLTKYSDYYMFGLNIGASF